MQNVKTKGLASILGVSDRTIRDLTARGVIARSGRDFALGETIKRYCDHLRALATGRGGEVAIASVTAERARLLKEQADSVAFKNAVGRREMVPVSEVESNWCGIVRTVRAGILAAPARIAQRLPQLTRHDIREIDAELRAVLTELGNADTPKVQK